MFWLYASIDHPGFAPSLQAVTLFEACAPFAYQQDMQVVTELLIDFMTEGLVGSACKHLWSQDAGKIAVLPEARQEMLAHVRNRAGMVALAEKIAHQVAQAVAPGMVLHPTGLESGILAVISEDDQFLLRGR